MAKMTLVTKIAFIEISRLPMKTESRTSVCIGQRGCSCSMSRRTTLAICVESTALLWDV